MQWYSLGFIFDRDLSRVLLIHKNRPTWQRGKLNGLGGKVETDETALDCIVREVREESGLQIEPDRWFEIGVMTSEAWYVTCFTCVYHGAQEDAYSVTDEQVEWMDVNALPASVISNLMWLIPLCRDRLSEANTFTFEIHYQ